ncbi:MAG TPA: IS1634 family transposase [Candidatus Lokiarchaeia archaeon]|nr:IS1634 family transposase [Candidatus Lokiarchaeia archaeon]
MPYSLITQYKKNGKYYSFHSSFRENGKVRSKNVYLGNEETALKLLADFNTKKPANERLLSFSGEKLLSKVLEMLDFPKVIGDALQKGPKLDAGRFVEMVVVERALNAFSKWGLAANAHRQSIFSLDPSVPAGKFTETNIYHYMDYLLPHLDAIQDSLVENLLGVSGLDMSELIVDGTSISCFGDDEAEDEDEGEGDAESEGGERDSAGMAEGLDKYREVKRVHGYNRDKRPDLAQVNLMLGVNDQSVPLFFQTFPGNTPDVYMFQAVLEKYQAHHSSLLAKIRNRYIVFDKGNNNPGNFRALDALCKKWQFHFVASIRPSLVAVRKGLQALAEDAPVIYTQKKTVIRGKTATLRLYGAPRTVLLYLNEEIRQQKQAAFQEKVKLLEAEVAGVLAQDDPAQDKVRQVESVLGKSKLRSCFVVEEQEDSVACTPAKEKLALKQSLLGKYALMTDDATLDAAGIFRIYKATSVVEQEFHHLKSDLAIGPIFHRKPDRIQVHFALVLWGMMALALLRCLLKQHSLDFTFETLRTKIQEGHVSIGDHAYPGGKSYRICKSLNVGKELKAIFQALRIKWEYFDIALVPTTINAKLGSKRPAQE